MDNEEPREFKRRSTDVKRFEFGPGVRHAIIWLSIITSFAAGWYTRGQIYEGEISTASLTVLREDIVSKQENRDQRELDKKNLDTQMEGKDYDPNCGDIKLNDFYW